MMSVNAKHPEYLSMQEDWRIMRDVFAGERHIKEQGTRYLPATRGMQIDGMGQAQQGMESYRAYVERAVFPDLVDATVNGMIGVMHREPAIIELPKKLAGLHKDASLEGETLQALLRRINEQQLLIGRFGLLIDVPIGGTITALPRIATYAAENIINWDHAAAGTNSRLLNFVVLDEGGFIREGLDWSWQPSFRVLWQDELGNYVTATTDNLDQLEKTSDLEATVPRHAGKPLTRLPFVLLGPNDVTAQPDRPPLLKLANLALAIYRGEADYRQSLFMQGQDTLVVIGAENDGAQMRVGAGAMINLPQQADAKFIGVSSTGLAEQRAALENDRRMASQLGVALYDDSGRSAESGEALKIRMASKAASLVSIAKTGAEALEQSLKLIAEWVGADPDEVSVTPNLAFAEGDLQAREIVDLMQSKAMGAPISSQTIHRNLRRRDITDLSFDQEIDNLGDEEVSAEKNVAE